MAEYRSERDVVLALALESKADPRTIRKWIVDPSRVVPSIAVLIEDTAERLGLMRAVAGLRGAPPTGRSP
jgi:hypothetical protein